MHHKYVAVRGGRQRTDDVKGTVCVVTLTVVLISAELRQSVLTVLLHHLCWVKILSHFGRFVLQTAEKRVPACVLHEVRQGECFKFLWFRVEAHCGTLHVFQHMWWIFIYLVVYGFHAYNWKVIVRWCFVGTICRESGQRVSCLAFDAGSKDDIEFKI